MIELCTAISLYFLFLVRKVVLEVVRSDDESSGKLALAPPLDLQRGQGGFLNLPVATASGRERLLILCV